MTAPIIINEVGLRDGLQNQPRLVPTEEKLALLDALRAAGLRHFEATSFVSPKAVPQMADAAALYAALPQDETTEYAALVPNRQGYERARAAGARSVAVVLSCTETMNQRNINMTLAYARRVSAEVMQQARADGLVGRAYLAVAFHCPFEGPVDPAVVRELAAEMIGAGAREIIIADTIGAADPLHVARLFDLLIGEHGAAALSGHFHDTKGLALANCFAALERGVSKFDASI